MNEVHPTVSAWLSETSSPAVGVLPRSTWEVHCSGGGFSPVPGQGAPGDPAGSVWPRTSQWKTSPCSGRGGYRTGQGNNGRLRCRMPVCVVVWGAPLRAAVGLDSEGSHNKVCHILYLFRYTISERKRWPALQEALHEIWSLNVFCKSQIFWPQSLHPHHDLIVFHRSIHLAH